MEADRLKRYEDGEAVMIEGGLPRLSRWLCAETAPRPTGSRLTAQRTTGMQHVS